MKCLRCSEEMTQNEESSAMFLDLEMCYQCRAETLEDRMRGLRVVDPEGRAASEKSGAVLGR